MVHASWGPSGQVTMRCIAGVLGHEGMQLIVLRCPVVPHWLILVYWVPFPRVVCAYFHAQVNTHLMSDLRCHSAQEARDALLGGSDGASALWDVAELADAAGAESLEVVLDCRRHGEQSLLLPGLAPFQGPAVCIAIPGKALTRCPLLPWHSAIS